MLELTIIVGSSCHKINGTIGSAAKDSLNYISLCSQIADGKKKGYTDDDIAMAVRKAVAAGSNLRTYLDSKTNMSLDSMLSFIRSALKEKSSSEWYQELNNTCQSNLEDAQRFVLRAMQLREKVLMASQAEGSLRYDERLVQALFLHTIRTGLKDDSTKARIEPFVRKDATISNEALIEELNLAASESAERRTKIGDKKKVTIAETSTSHTVGPDVVKV